MNNTSTFNKIRIVLVIAIVLFMISETVRYLNREDPVYLYSTDDPISFPIEGAQYEDVGKLIVKNMEPEYIALGIQTDKVATTTYMEIPSKCFFQKTEQNNHESHGYSFYRNSYKTPTSTQLYLINCKE